MARPGVMLYFDMLEPLRALSDGEKGQILMGILEYARDGTPPEFQGMTALAWSFIKPRLDRDIEEYDRIVLRRRYAAFCRERKRKNEPELTFDEWLKCPDPNLHHGVSHDECDDQWHPNTDTTKTTDTTKATDTTKTTDTNTDSNTAAAANTGADAQAAAAERKLKRLYGELGQGVVNLSEYHIRRLLDLMGIDMFDHYVKKLSDFILREGASVKNHYQTILKWWTEDSAP